MSDDALPRAVFDTNILFSAMGWRGRPYECLQEAIAGKVELLTCREIVTELHAKLISKLRMSRADTDRAVSEILLTAQLVELGDIPLVVADDPDDDAVLACAVEGGANSLVTGDHHLLQLGQHEGIPIVNAKDFLEHLASAEVPDQP